MYSISGFTIQCSVTSVGGRFLCLHPCTYVHTHTHCTVHTYPHTLHCSHTPTHTLHCSHTHTVYSHLHTLVCTHTLTCTPTHTHPTVHIHAHTHTHPHTHVHACTHSIMQEVEGMNARLINKYKDLVSQYSDCHRRVLPVVNTCLDNITSASEFVDANKVCNYGDGQFVHSNKS